LKYCIVRRPARFITQVVADQAWHRDTYQQRD
jgi:hypothetical protein